MGLEEVHRRFWWGNLGQGDHFGDLGTNERILKWVSRSGMQEHRLDLSGSR
jgi:hypothetical protein